MQRNWEQFLALNQRNIYFVGLMGAGKSTLGRALARKLEKPFFDSDLEVQARCGVQVSVIFDLEGEQGFRQRESQIIQELTQQQGIVLATGGGVVLREENRARLRCGGTVIYLCATPRELWSRLHHDRSRPLLQTADPLAQLTALYAQRDPLYREIADFVIDTGRPSVTRLLQTVLCQLEGIGFFKS